MGPRPVFLGETFEVSHYLIVMVDILGHGDRLARIAPLGVPTSDEDAKEFRVAFDEALGRLVQFRRQFEAFVEAFFKAAAVPPDVPPEHREAYANSRRREIKIRSFSDCLIVSGKLTADPEFGNWRPVATISSLMLGTAALQLLMLSQGIPVRGALAVGLGAEIYGDGEYFGPALDEAYRLERNAGEPRIAVSQTLVDLLDRKLTPEPPVEGLQAAVNDSTAVARKLIITAHDGSLMLDVLSDEVRPLVDPLRSGIAQRAHSFVRAEWLRYQSAKDHKLAGRYYALLRYFDDHIGPWTS